MRKILMLAAAVVMVCCLGAPASADEVAELKDEVAALKEMVNRLEQRLSAECAERMAAEEAVTGKVAEVEEKVAEVEDGYREAGKHITYMEGRVPLLQEGALTMSAGMTVVGQGSAGADFNTGKDSVDGSFSVDVELSRSVFDTDVAFVHLEGGQGDGLMDELPSFYGVNADATGGDARIEIADAYYEHGLMDGKMKVAFGKLDMTSWFDGNEAANDERFQFLSGGFVNNAAVEFPDNAAGLRWGYDINDLFGMQLGAQAGDSDWEDIIDNMFGIAQLDVRPKFGEMQGNYRMYGWVNGVNHTSFSGPVDETASGWGVGASLDQQVAENVTLFSRLGYQDRDVYPFEFAWSLGGSVGGGIWGRADDSFGLGWGMAHLSTGYKDSGAFAEMSDEGHLEAYYRLSVNKFLDITPDVQVITNPEGDGGFGSAVIFGVRAQATF
ncbi:MAG: carbohydrate porin [Nitrospirae bacterium]|nr:carbohydrate porin [Nitrospirota bacterium]